MQVPNLLRTVLKPRGLPTSSKKPPGNSRGNRRDGGSQSTPPKVSCLCSPTNHAGSFRCRLHRSSQRKWGGRSLSYSSTPSSVISATRRTSSSVSSMPSTFDFTSVGRTLPRVHPRLGIARHRIRPSRLSRMVNATDLDADTLKKIEKATSQKLIESALLKTFPGRSTGIDLSTNSDHDLQPAVCIAASSTNSKEHEENKGMVMATAAQLSVVVNEASSKGLETLY